MITLLKDEGLSNARLEVYVNHKTSFSIPGFIPSSHTSTCRDGGQHLCPNPATFHTSFACQPAGPPSATNSQISDTALKTQPAGVYYFSL